MIANAVSPALAAALCLAWLLPLARSAETLQPLSPATTTPEWRAKAAEILERLPAPVQHHADLPEAEQTQRLQQERSHELLVQEKLQDRWFAALVATSKEERFAIQDRFATWRDFVEFLRDQDALVEVWAYPEGAPEKARRVHAPELAALKRQPREQPTFVTVTYRDRETGHIGAYRVEFGFQAAEVTLAAHQGYLRHRELQLAAREVLAARDAAGRFSAVAQWEALGAAIEEAQIPIAELPPKPTDPRDLFVAVEYEVDELNNFTRIARFFRESEIRKRIVNDTQVLVLKRAGEKTERLASGYRTRGVSDQLEALPAPLPGRDQVELRIQVATEPDVRQWPVLEFGEPELLKESALARFALISAHLERQRKALLVKKSNLDLIAEPIIATINISGGLTGLDFPAGDAARLLYNVISPAFIPHVPDVKQFRELFAFLAAKERDPALKTKPARYLSPDDIKRLTEAGRHLSDAEIHETLDRVSEDDLRGMLRLARMGMWDARLTAAINILISAGKISGETEAGWDRDVFNSVYFSLNGDINLKNIFAMLIGKKVWTPLSGTSLQTLSRGQGPPAAWFQFFDLSVNVRAVLNTLFRLGQRSLADKELNKPFPYAPRTSDLAAYEVRAFGFPLLIFYKRGLIRKDYEAYEHDYAYGILGVKIVEHFPTREDMEREIRARRMVPLGFVRVPSGKGKFKETNLAVFAHRIPAGRYKGKTALIIYGLKAYEEHSDYIERELKRFKEFEQALVRGGVIEQLVEAEDASQLPAHEFEPKLAVGANAVEEVFAPLLGNLLELRRARLHEAWGFPMQADDQARLDCVREALAAQNVRADDPEAFQGVDRFNSLFFYHQQVEGKWRLMKMVSIAGLADIQREVRKAQEAKRIEQMRREAAAGKSEGVVIINQVQERDGCYELGPLLEKPPEKSSEPKSDPPPADRERAPPSNRADSATLSPASRDPLSPGERAGVREKRASTPHAAPLPAFASAAQPTLNGPDKAPAAESEATDFRTSPSPSPRPSPVGRGRTAVGVSRAPEIVATSSPASRGPLSPGERAGVRGNATAESTRPFLLASAAATSGEELSASHHAAQLPSLSIRSGAQALDEIFELLQRLPVTDRARLRFNHFAATIVNLDLDGDSQREKVFLTIEFPLGPVTREWTNPLSGERERLVFENGLWKKAITDQRITELDYDDAKVETRSRTYFNRGTRDAPVEGDLLAETRTLETWFRDLGKPDLDPYLPIISKLHLNHVTGQVSRETYGLFPLPVETVDDQFITRHRYNAQGVFASAKVLDNGASDPDFKRPLLEKLLHPIAGRERFELTSTIPNLAELWHLKEQDYKTTVLRKDLVKGLTKTVVFDNARDGRKLSENYLDLFDGAQTFAAFATNEYHGEFFFGLIPTRTTVRSGAAGVLLTDVRTTSYDAATRQLTGVVTDYTGKVATNTWDYRWENPVQVATALRTTTTRYNRDETSVTGTTTANSPHEEAATFSGLFDATTRTWQIKRNLWHRPGVLLRAETDTLSGFGKLIASQAGDEFLSRPAYDADGREQTRRTARRNPATGQFDLLHRVENDYRWQSGQRDAHVQTYVDGQPYDESRTLTDSEGRTIVEAIKTFPGLELRTVTSHDGGTERRLKAELLQNSEARLTHEFLVEQKQADGSYQVRVKGLPFWGLTFTNTYRLEDPLARPLATTFENGESVKIIEWFPGTAIAKVSELRDRHGRVRERWLSRLNAGTDAGLPYDLLTRTKVGYWGATGVAEERAVLRGTDQPLFKSAPEERVHFDLTQRYAAPRYGVDPRLRRGLTVALDGGQQPRATTIFRSRFADQRDPLDASKPLERVLVVEALDLQGLFYHKFTQTTFDRAGRTLSEQVGKIPNPGAGGYTEQSLFSAIARERPLRWFRYHYAPGWFVEQKAPKTDEPIVLFTDQPPPAASTSWRVNDTAWREVPTQVDGLDAPSNPDAAPAELLKHLFRRLGHPRELRRNPHQPEVADVWTARTATEFNAAGQPLFASEIIFNARGHPSTTIARKKNSSGALANKLAYYLSGPAADAWQQQAVAKGTNRVAVSLGGAGDLSDSDFLYLYVAPQAASELGLEFKDASANVALAGEQLTPGVERSLQFWPVASGQVQWLPNKVIPERGAVVTAPAFTEPPERVLAVSVAQLAKVGLDIRRLDSATLILAAPSDGQLRFTPLFRLVHGGEFLRDETPHQFVLGQSVHPGGLTAHTQVRRDRTRAEVRSGKGWYSVVRLDGLAVATAHPRDRWPPDSALTLLDYSDPDVPRPLYSVKADTGEFLEYYQSRLWGDAQVYTVASGFETPRLEVFRGAVLDDEISPGLLAFGRGFHVTLPLAKASGGFARTVADLQNRMTASIFTVGGDQVLSLFSQPTQPAQELVRLNSELGSATNQAAAIARLSLLAQALLPRRELPWQQPGLPATNAALLETNLWRRLNQLATNYQQSESLPQGTGLLPTAPGTEVERYVDTVKEAELIQLAVKLEEYPLASSLLTNYLDKAEGGTVPLHASYDARTGANLAKEPRNERPFEAPRTADAQLAIAEAAFLFGLETGDTNALAFGKNLVTLVLQQFVNTNAPSPRGVAETQPWPEKRRLGLTQWPEAHHYPLRSNARLYLLLNKLNDDALRRVLPDSEWRVTVRDALREQEAWLTNHILPQLEQTGVAPKGLFQIQDVHDDKTALGVERWTAAEDWLLCLEAADRLGVPKESTRRWLENLARVHGVTVAGVWGLDWSVALLRADAISPELTARFVRVAEQIGHREAVEFARANLAALRQEGTFPAVFTPAPPLERLDLGEGNSIYPREDKEAWPESLNVHWHLMDQSWNLAGPVATSQRLPSLTQRPPRDIYAFLWTAAGFYLSIFVVAAFWWHRSAKRKQRHAELQARSGVSLLVPDAVMQRAEERWAKRVLGARTPANAERSRFSNCATEQNFHMQLRALYKLVLEWRRLENQWTEDDPRLADDASDPWLNGLDEFATMVGLYSRWVVKAGRKDGFPQADVLAENEDSNHIWSRLVMYFSEHHWGLLEALRQFKAEAAGLEILTASEQIVRVLRALGLRERLEPFDAREAFNVPANAAAMDLLGLQLPGATLAGLVDQMAGKLGTPRAHIVAFIKGYKEFKHREQLFPVHPHVLEAAKLMPHFILMGLVALIWYNNHLNGMLIYPYLKETVLTLARSAYSLTWAVPLFAGFAFSVAAYFLSVYRHQQRLRARRGDTMFLEATLTSFFAKKQSATPTMRESRWWDPVWCLRVGWTLRALGLLWLGVSLLRIDAPSFATFLILKGLLAGLIFVEAGAVLVPLIVSRFSMWLEDRVAQNPKAWPFTRFLNQLNLTATRPASVIWLSFKYHFQPSVPTGGAVPMTLAVVYYLALAAVFFGAGGYVCKEVLRVWFADTYQNGWDFRLLLGALLFWNTMYLLRFGLHVLFTGTSAFLVTFPVKAIVGVFGLAFVADLGFQGPSESFVTSYPTLSYGLLIAVLAVAVFEQPILAWLKNAAPLRRRRESREAERRARLAEWKADKNHALGVIYMSGDELSYLKLTPDLLMSRWTLLRGKLDSSGARLLALLNERPDDATLAQWFEELHELEKKHDVTMWHPMQIVVSGSVSERVSESESPGPHPPAHQLTHSAALPEELGLNLPVDSLAQRDRLLRAWHVRRWLVTMMSTAGHSQDTGITLADIALRLQQEGLAPNVVFYLIQNKYDNADHNRPSQLAYDKGELGQRNKLARLLMALAPGARAYSLNDWTPFGFKAGGLVGMDLVHEESLKLTNMLVMDRNATVHDLDALMEDITLALADPGVVIVVPGRSTTNTLTPLGQGSQLVEEGHRAMLTGFRLLGGRASEAIGTGWGNLQAVFYGRVQRALVDPNVPKMPLTSRMKRGTPFGDRFEGLIGFGPHAVGISEDIWAVMQAAHNAIALGLRAQFEHSKAMWHKIRETWSHAEWFSAFSRWSGGYLQMMHDPLMQRINDEGPLNVFAKELRANNGRYYLSAPFAMLNILLMPLAIILGVSPFVQILVVLWNFGFVLNQVLTLHGLVACLEATGFARGTALAGAAVGAGLSAVLPGWNPFAPAVIAFGFLAGGFALGLGRWLYDRGRDIILFGPQLVIHALGQFVRQSLEFLLSGASANDARGVNVAFRSWAGPREDRPFESYPNILNLRTVIWIVGLLSLLLSLFALSHLDFLNVVLLLPSLLFSVSTLAGPFLMRPRVGESVGRHVWIVKLLGWLAGGAFYSLIAWLLARGGWWESVGVLGLAGCLGAVLWRGLRYVGYGRKLSRLSRRLADLLVAGGLARNEAKKLATQIVRGFASEPDKVQAALNRAGVRAETHAGILDFVQTVVLPHLRKPMTDLERGRWGRSRFVSEFSRSFVLALFTFLWFFIVPIPGLLVLSVFEYRISLDLSTVLFTVLGAVGAALAGLAISCGLEWWTCRGLTGRGLIARVAEQFRRFQSLLQTPGKLTATESASLHALFTDAQTYFDQRGYAYVRRTLGAIEEKLNAAATREAR